MKAVLLFASLCFLTACSLSKAGDSTTSLPRSERSLGDISKFLSFVASADDVQVYEGLPHQNWEREQYATEKRRSDLVKFEGFSFYAKPLDISDEEKKRLTVVALKKESHVPFRGMKFCGGYHPDYAIVWMKSGKKGGSLICFGCHEWKNFTPEGRLCEDLDSAAYDELRAILSKYVAQRPKRKQG